MNKDNITRNNENSDHKSITNLKLFCCFNA